MPRLFVPPGSVGAGTVTIAGEILRRARTVLRLREGDEVVLTDGTGQELVVRLGRLGRDGGEASILERSRPRRESPLHTVLAQALPRGDRFEAALEKAVELGVSGIVPLLTRRTVPAAGGAGDARLGRWLRVAESALAQSGRTVLPRIGAPRTLEALADEPGGDGVRLLLCPGPGPGLDEVVAGAAAPRSVLVAVGPEGGWDGEEAAYALERGFRAVSLGPRVLRSGTAGLAALAVLQHRWGDLG